MENFYDELVKVLKKDKRFFSEDGALLRNTVSEAGNRLDRDLLRMLLGNKATKKHLFADVDGTMVFDKVKFGWVVNNREFLPDSYTRFKNKIGLVDERGEFISDSRDVSLVFPYKDCVLEGGQTKEEQKRDEIFYNETLAPNEVDRLLAPKVLTNAVRYDAKGKKTAKEFDAEKDNLIIKGNNLLAIYSLLERCEGKVDCIYIDPPYNPPSNANTFAYNNTFNRSTWLTFMRNRLLVARKLLSPDGVMIVAIDKNEQPRLQILIEEVFPDREVDCITVVHNPRGTIGTNFSYTHEFAIFVTPFGKKSIADRRIAEEDVDWSPLRNWGTESLRTDAKNCFYPIKVKGGEIVGFGDVCEDSVHPSQTEKHGEEYWVYPIDGKGVERKWRYARQTVESILTNLRPKKTAQGYDIELGKDFGVCKTVWTDSKYDANKYGTQLLKDILPDTKFTYPKSLYNVMDCVDLVVRGKKDALILDFFGGSGTTGHAVLEMNGMDGGHRRFILVEQMDYVETDTLMRNVLVMRKLKQKGAIVYCELLQSNERFVDRIRGAKKDGELLLVWKDMQKTGFISCKYDPKKKLDFADAEFKALTLNEKKKVLMSLLDKNQLYVNLCDMDDAEFGVSAADKTFTNSFYGRK